MERLLRKFVARIDSPLSQVVCSGGKINAQEKQRRSTEALQDLEDERLERCKSADPFTFDQCFFFGSADATESRRLLEGGGTLPSSGERNAGGVEGAGTRQTPGKRIPTW